MIAQWLILLLCRVALFFFYLPVCIYKGYKETECNCVYFGADDTGGDGSFTLTLGQTGDLTLVHLRGSWEMAKFTAFLETSD